MTIITSKSIGEIVASTDINAIVNKIQNGTDNDIKLSGITTSDATLLSLSRNQPTTTLPLVSFTISNASDSQPVISISNAGTNSDIYKTGDMWIMGSNRTNLGEPLNFNSTLNSVIKGGSWIKTDSSTNSGCFSIGSYHSTNPPTNSFIAFSQGTASFSDGGYGIPLFGVRLGSGDSITDNVGTLLSLMTSSKNLSIGYVSLEVFSNVSTNDRRIMGIYGNQLTGTLPIVDIYTTATNPAIVVNNSSTVCTNLNADLLDGQHGSYYGQADRLISTNSTLILSDDTSNQTLTGNLGNLTITPTGKFIIASGKQSEFSGNVNPVVKIQTTTDGITGLVIEQSNPTGWWPNNKMLQVTSYIGTAAVFRNTYSTYNTTVEICKAGYSTSSIQIYDGAGHGGIYMNRGSGTLNDDMLSFNLTVSTSSARMIYLNRASMTSPSSTILYLRHAYTGGTTGDAMVYDRGGTIRFRIDHIGALSAYTTKIYDSTPTNYTEISHSGTVGKITTNLGNLALTSATLKIVPFADDTHSLGDGLYRWLYGYFHNIYLNGTSPTFEIRATTGAPSLALYNDTTLEQCAWGQDAIKSSITSSNRLDIISGGTYGINITPATGTVLFPASAYLNFGTTTGDSGYGFRDNSGTMQFKNSGGSWISLEITDLPVSSAQYTTLVGNTTSGWVENTSLKINGSTIFSDSEIAIKPSADSDDYISFYTASNIPWMKVNGGDTMGFTSDDANNVGFAIGADVSNYLGFGWNKSNTLAYINPTGGKLYVGDVASIVSTPIATLAQKGIFNYYGSTTDVVSWAIGSTHDSTAPSNGLAAYSYGADADSGSYGIPLVAVRLGNSGTNLNNYGTLFACQTIDHDVSVVRTSMFVKSNVVSNTDFVVGIDDGDMTSGSMLKIGNSASTYAINATYLSLYSNNEIILVSSNNIVRPDADDDTDLGTASYRFKNLYLGSTIYSSTLTIGLSNTTNQNVKFDYITLSAGPFSGWTFPYLRGNAYSGSTTITDAGFVFKRSFIVYPDVGGAMNADDPEIILLENTTQSAGAWIQYQNTDSVNGGEKDGSLHIRTYSGSVKIRPNDPGISFSRFLEVDEDSTNLLLTANACPMKLKATGNIIFDNTNSMTQGIEYGGSGSHSYIYCDNSAVISGFIGAFGNGFGIANNFVAGSRIDTNYTGCALGLIVHNDADTVEYNTVGADRTGTAFKNISIQLTTAITKIISNAKITFAGGSGYPIINITPTATPTTGITEGDIYSDSTAKKLYYYNGTSWVDLSASGTLPSSTAQYSVLVANSSNGWVEDTAFKINAGSITAGVNARLSGHSAFGANATIDSVNSVATNVGLVIEENFSQVVNPNTGMAVVMHLDTTANNALTHIAQDVNLLVTGTETYSGVICGQKVYTNYNSSGTNSGFVFGQWLLTEDGINNPATAILGGQYFQMNRYSSSTCGTYAGITFDVQNKSGAGAVTDMWGINLSMKNGSNSNITTVRFVTAQGFRNSGTGTVGEATDMYLQKPVNDGGGTITNVYGLYIEDMSGIGSSISYNISSKGSNSMNRFEGTIKVGSDSNYANISSSGNMTFVGTASLFVPTWTTGTRPGGSTGQVGLNTTTSQFEGYNGSAWVILG